MTRESAPGRRLTPDGTPTRAWLAALRRWPAARWAELPPEMATGWRGAGWAREVRPGRWVFGTGGWTVNEQIVEAARRSPAWRVPDIIELPNGLYIIPTTREAAAEVSAIMSWVVQRAWSPDIVR